jgi:hypothetical protein
MATDASDDVNTVRAVAPSAKAVGDIFAFGEDVGRAIEGAWAQHHFHVDRFADVAARGLAEVEIPATLDPEAILRAVATKRDLVRQEDPRSTFGRPPVTLWRSRYFFVSALYWLDGAPAIHQHGFSGAFKVLAGGSLHVPYRFSTSESITHRLVLGDLSMGEPEILQVGDVRPIERGSAFIHGLFHLDRPSVTIVVRTYGEPVGEPQFTYLRPGIGFDPFYRDDTVERRFESIVTLADLDAGAGVAAACQLVEGEDIWVGFLMAMRWFHSVERSKGLDRILDAFARRHGSAAKDLVGSFPYQHRTFTIASRRRLVHDPEHRLFLALLLNLPDRAAIDTVLATRYPGEDPGELLARWVAELASPEQRGISGIALGTDALASVTEALRAGRTGALGSVGLREPPPTILEDLFKR